MTTLEFETELRAIQHKIEHLILSTPTSKKRDRLTELNILIEDLISDPENPIKITADDILE